MYSLKSVKMKGDLPARSAAMQASNQTKNNGNGSAIA
jgi:hypothetical protein